jgi:hypothetical protein
MADVNVYFTGSPVIPDPALAIAGEITITIAPNTPLLTMINMMVARLGNRTINDIGFFGNEGLVYMTTAAKNPQSRADLMRLAAMNFLSRTNRSLTFNWVNALQPSRNRRVNNRMAASLRSMIDPIGNVLRPVLISVHNSSGTRFFDHTY